MDLVRVLVEDPPCEVIARLGRHAAVARVLPLAAAEVQDASGVVADALLHLDEALEEMSAWPQLRALNTAKWILSNSSCSNSGQICVP